MKAILLSIFFFSGCSSVKNYEKTVEFVDIKKFMGDWYVVAARPTFLEKGATNSLERYIWNEKENRIDIDFTFRKNTPLGKLKKIPQKAWIYNKKSNAHWKVQPFWPLKLDYIVVDLDPDYQWTTVGVPGQDYVWIMARDWKMPEDQIDSIIKRLKEKGYNTDDIIRIEHKW